MLHEASIAFSRFFQSPRKLPLTAPRTEVDCGPVTVYSQKRRTITPHGSRPGRWLESAWMTLDIISIAMNPGWLLTGECWKKAGREQSPARTGKVPGDNGQQSVRVAGLLQQVEHGNQLAGPDALPLEQLQRVARTHFGAQAFFIDNAEGRTAAKNGSEKFRVVESAAREQEIAVVA